VTVDASIILETDNAVGAPASETRRALNLLADELASCERPTELIVVYDGNHPDAALDSALKDLQQVCTTPTRVSDEPGSTYYAQKNLGASVAAGDILVFLDSDVLPERGWLPRMLASFDDPGVEVVAATTYTDRSSLADKALALTWKFPLRSAGGAPRTVRHFNANAVAFRRDTFRRHPFPEDERYRGQCHTLAVDLLSSGIEIIEDPNVRIAHPPPRGFREITVRGLCQGHDRVLTYRLAGRRRVLWPTHRALAYDMREAAQRIRRERSRVQLSVWEAPAAIVVAWWYYACVWVGGMIASVSPQLIRRHLRI
jgi:glycosyltransferase involved in cell wall biosynthesis